MIHVIGSAVKLHGLAAPLLAPLAFLCVLTLAKPGGHLPFIWVLEVHKSKSQDHSSVEGSIAADSS